MGGSAVLTTPPPAGRREGARPSARDAALAWGLRALVLLLAVCAVLWARHALFADGARPHGRVQRVALVSTPRPPPPKLPEKPPEPVRETEARLEQAVVTPSQKAAPAAGEQLGVDADAQGAGDDFGLVGRRGGRDITTLGDKSGEATADARQGAGSTQLVRQVHRAYAQLVTQRLRSDLAGDARLVTQGYVTVVQLWIGRPGGISRVDFERGSGSAVIDSVLRDVLSRAGPFPEPPHDLPFPIRIRIESKEIGRSGH